MLFLSGEQQLLCKSV